MALQLPDRWLWDFWFARDGDDIHLFYLQAPRSLERQELRHWHVSIGHAVSRDLRSWTLLPDALAPGDADASPEPFDSASTWTGSVVRHQDRWQLLYTGAKKSEQGLIQRIGLATSDDLKSWRKHPDNPVLTLDERWYEALGEDWHDQAWRDPWVFHDPATGRFHALITARGKQGPADGRGVIGHASSADLVRWEVHPPLTEAGEFGHMEVPQLVELGGRWYLLFSCPHRLYAAARKARPGVRPQSGTHYLVADQPLGPFRYLEDDFLVGDEGGSLYSGKLIELNDSWFFLAFRNCEDEGAFVGELSDPYPVRVLADGRLRVSGTDS